MGPTADRQGTRPSMTASNVVIPLNNVGPVFVYLEKNIVRRSSDTRAMSSVARE